MSNARRILILLTVAFLLFWMVLAVSAYDRLPAMIATHFGGSGRVDGFTRRSLGSWFHLPVFGAVLTVVCSVTAQLILAKPSLWNFEGKPQLLSLPAASQRLLFEDVAVWLTAVGSSVTLLFAAIHYDVWRVAMHNQHGLSIVSGSAIALSLGGLAFGTPLWMMRFNRRVMDAATKAGR